MLASPTITHIARICAALILIMLVQTCTHSIKEKASATDRPVIMVSLTSLDRFLDYPCEPSTEDYRYDGYIMCERRHDYVPGKRTVWPSPFSKPRVE